MTIINKLYELASSGDLDAASELKGCLHLQVGERAKMEYLTNMFPNKLFITASNYIIPFEDQNMVTYLNSIGVGSNGVITEADAAAVTVVANSLNTTVTKFNELRYFTNITESRGGISGSADGWVRFKEWTSLEEIDISNFTSIGHILTSGTGDTFEGCTSLKTVTASNKLGSIGFHAFKGCSNLEEITGLDNTIAVYGYAFLDCPKLDSSCFANTEILFPTLTYERDGMMAFYGDTNITNITLSDSNTWIPYQTFKGTKLKTINIPSSITYFGESCFENTDLLINASLISNAQTYNRFCFKGTKITGTFAPTNANITLGEGCFRECTSLQGVDLSNTTLTEVWHTAFNGDSSITTVVLPNTCTKLGQSSFEGCSNLTSINLSNVTEFLPSCLYGCSSLHITQNDITNATSIGGGAFSRVASLPNHLVLPHLTYIGAWPWSDPNIISADFTGSTFTLVEGGLFESLTNLDHVTMPASVTLFNGWGWFRYCQLRWIKFLGTTCPGFTNSNQDETYLNLSSTKIYVPDSAVTTYLTGWPSLSSLIFPMSLFSTDFPND